MFGSGIPNPNLTDETGIRIAEAIEALGGGGPESESEPGFGSGIPNPNITDETGIRIAEALENLEPGGGSSLPETTPEDAGKVLGVNEEGEWDKMDLPSGGGPTVVHFVYDPDSEEVSCDLTPEELAELLEPLFEDGSGFNSANFTAVLKFTLDDITSRDTIWKFCTVERNFEGNYSFTFLKFEYMSAGGGSTHLFLRCAQIYLHDEALVWYLNLYSRDLGENP